MREAGASACEIVVLRDPVVRDVAREAMRVVASGGIPLVVDDRWTLERVQETRELVAGIAPPAGAAFATMTSGTTAGPRIVVRSLESWSLSFATIERLLALTADDVVYLPSPPCSSLSMFSIAHAQAAGFALALPSGHAVRARDFEGATVVHCTPSAFRAVLDAIDEGAPHELRVALLGGSHVPAGLRERAAERGIHLISYYGAAELSFVAVDVDGSGLRAFDGVDLEVRDGHLWVRSAFAALGYLSGDGPFATDGEWMTVGDLARIDDGIVTVLGRVDGAILSASATIIPADVEAAIEQAPGVREAVVVGIENDRVGALVAAVVEAPHGVSIDDLRAATAQLLPSHRPRRWFVVDELPRTATGKPARSEISRRIADGELIASVR